MKASVSHILILTTSPFSKRDYDRFGVELLRQSFRVSILDCTAWLKPDFWGKYSAIVHSCPGYVSVANWAAMASCLDGKEDAVVIDYLDQCSSSRRIRAELRRRNILRAVVRLGVIPVPLMKWSDRVRQMGSLYKPFSLVKKLCGRIGQVFSSRDPPPEIALLSGTACLHDRGLHAVVHKIWTHSFDFDFYLGCQKEVSVSAAPYAVFLDVNVIYDSDYDYLGMKSPATERAYYASMNEFFRTLEDNIGLPVVVAAHPRSRHDLHPHLWNKRTVICGKTAQLVRDASVVLCHQSTAVSFAVMWRKPIIFLTTNELMSSYIGPRIALMSTRLGAPLLNVDRDCNQLPNVMPDIKSLPSVDEVAYAKYSDEYIKRSGTPNLPVWQVFSDYLQRESLR